MKKTTVFIFLCLLIMNSYANQQNISLMGKSFWKSGDIKINVRYDGILKSQVVMKAGDSLAPKSIPFVLPPRIITFTMEVVNGEPQHNCGTRHYEYVNADGVLNSLTAGGNIIGGRLQCSFGINRTRNI